MAVQENGKKLLSQNEVANIFGVSANTIKNWRRNRILSYVRVPGSTRKFYLQDQIDELINRHTKHRKGGGSQLKTTKLKGKPRVSSKSDKDWRIE